MTSIALQINGTDYLDFVSVSVTMSMEQFARTFSISFSDKWLNSLQRLLPFDEGDPCKITIDGETVIDGFIDDISIRYNGTDHSIDIGGRSWTGHLVDCSAIHKAGAWKNATLLVIAEDICKPFGVKPKLADPTLIPEVSQPFRKWAIDEEETAHECIVRAAKMRGMFVTSDAGRNLLFTRASKIPSTLQPLKRGVNILSGTRTSSFQDRYSEYIVKAESCGDDTWFGEDATSKLFHRAKDEFVEIYRPLIIVSDGQGTKPELERRANWERNIRAGRARRITYEVQGATNPDGFVWEPNTTVPVVDEYFDTDDTLLITTVNIRQSNTNTTTSLELSRPEAFDVMVPPKKKPKKRRGKYTGMF